MAQEEIIQLLEKNKEMTKEELSRILGISLIAVWSNLKGLLKEFEVERRALSKEETEKLGKKFTGRNMVWKLRKE